MEFSNEDINKNNFIAVLFIYPRKKSSRAKILVSLIWRYLYSNYGRILMAEFIFYNHHHHRECMASYRMRSVTRISFRIYFLLILEINEHCFGVENLWKILECNLFSHTVMCRNIKSSSFNQAFVEDNSHARAM